MNFRYLLMKDPLHVTEYVSYLTLFYLSETSSLIKDVVLRF